MVRKTSTWAEIDLNHLEENLNTIKKNIRKDSKICAVLKADAYGHGAVEVAKFLEDKDVEYFSVARIEEGLELRDANITKKILCMGAINKDYVEEAIEKDITLTVFNYETASFINDIASKLKKTATIHIKINSGMNRIGFYANLDSINYIREINKLAYINIEGIFTHFAKADELDKTETYNQVSRFKYVLNSLESNGINIKYVHVSNSASTIDIGDFGFNMVRVGIAMYGLNPSNDVKILNLKPVLKLKTKVVENKIINSGEGVSYGYNYIASKPTRILTLPIGYADGFFRGQRNASVLIDTPKGKVRGKVVGNICMDQCMVEVDIDRVINIDSEVSIIDEYAGVTADDIAKRIGTINYEVICMISRRVSRVYNYNKNMHSRDYLRD